MATRLTVPERLVLDWGATIRRDLAWRHVRDPWWVLVSEVMLAQTQVSRVERRWIEFVERWPTPESLTRSTLAEVLVFWQGLGYPRRAANLYRSAEVIVTRHAGVVPSSIQALLELPGIGPYTARAILAFAYESDVGVVDTNIARVLARVDGRRLTPGEAQRLADSWVPSGEGWAWNQSMMDLGALYCRPVDPACGGCPMARSCRWHTGGLAGPDPAIGSAGVSGRQARFAGSDRQARGRLLARLGAGPLPLGDATSVCGFDDDDRAVSIVDGLVSDGLVSVVAGELHLGGPTRCTSSGTGTPR